MKKKIAIIIFLVFVILVLLGLLFIRFTSTSNVGLIKTSFTFEYGVVVELRGENILDTENNAILKSFRADYSKLKFEDGKKYPKVGTYDLQIDYSVNGSDKQTIIKIAVEDTKGPEFTTFPDKIEIKKGTDLNTLATNFNAKDVSPFEITVNAEKLDINQTGEFEVEVTATDSYKNKSVRKANIIVIEDKVDINSSPTIDSKPKPPSADVVKPTYVNGIMIVNKKNPVPSTYMPYENAEAGKQARSMIKEMQDLGYNIHNSYSGFRSFDTQAGLYQNYVTKYGKQEADTFSARAGYSEHQTGLAFDLLHKNGTLVETSPEVNWISKNAHRYGFIVRYLAGKEHITGYQAEPWHIRYIGTLATDIYNSGLTLEEYLGVPGGSY